MLVKLEAKDKNINGKIIDKVMQNGEVICTIRPAWISVKDKLPEKHIWVLVCNRNGFDVGFINSQGKWTDTVIDPEFWMTLPEPPESLRGEVDWNE